MRIHRILGPLREAGLIHWVDNLRYLLQYLRNARSNRNFMIAHPEIALPPPYMLYESFRLDYRKYWESGKDTADWIKSLLAAFLQKTGPLNILDWGCGPSRVLRHLPQAFGTTHQYFGTDYNEKTIAWCTKHIQAATFAPCPLYPPTGYPDDTFDIITGISVFTHLPETAHYLWRTELARIAKPGALLFLTTQGPAFTEKLTREEQEKYASQQLLVRAKTREGHRTFSAFHPFTWTRAFFEAEFELLKYLPGEKKSWGIEQDVWILRKP